MIRSLIEKYFYTDEDMTMSQHVILLGMVLFCLIFLIWANWASLDEVTRGQGKVIPSSEVQTLQSLDAGIIEEFLVKEGDEVEAGQVILRMSDIEASSDLGANQARYLGLLAATQRLQAESEGRDMVEFSEEVKNGAPESVAEEMNAFRANKLQIQGQLDILKSQESQRSQEVNELNTRISDVRGVLALLKDEQAVIQPLVARGSAPQLELLQLERSIKEKQTELNSAQSSLPRAQSAVSEARARINDISTSAQAKAQEEFAVKLREMNEIKERLSALSERKTRTEVKSPVNGTVQDITINTVGGVTRPGDALVRIVPKDDQLIVEAQINPKDRAFIYPGQSAMIKVTAYDFSIYGGLKGEVLDISADTVTDDQGNSFYRVRLRTFDKELKRNGQVLPIIPGMVAQVDILTGQKTVMEYLMKPLIKTLNNAMSER
jgi:adhesin transport system membrane fusion protein